MTTLFKTEKDVKVSFPRININDDFKNKFFKLARYVSKIADVDSIDVLECVKVLEGDTIDFSAYDICSFEELLADSKRAATNALIVLDNRTKADVSNAIFCYAEGEPKKPIYLIVPSCPTANDGSLFCVRGQVDYRNCRIYSIGYLLVASALEQTVKNFISDKSYSIFNYSSSLWKYSNYCSIYEAALDTIINVEYNHSLNREYARESGKTISTFRTDKKYQDEALNKSTLFNKMGFRKVEIDTGHYLDFKHGDEVYSEMSAFFPIIKAYEKKLLELAEDSKYVQKLTAKRMSYYLIPTEVFARAFELWVSGTIVSDATIISSTETYNSQPEYIAFSHIKELVFSFFDAIFPNTTISNQSMVATLRSQKETTVPKAKVWEEIAPTNTGEQLSLF